MPLGALNAPALESKRKNAELPLEADTHFELTTHPPAPEFKTGKDYF